MAIGAVVVVLGCLLLLDQRSLRRPDLPAPIAFDEGVGEMED